ncbi:MAG: bifunctional phosphoserine phosphatase/homoserine phosphotransferase ThrH [Promethearchaeota archaeon]
MFIICLDLEGVFTPEIWIEVSLKTKIEELKITTRDEPDYDKLMKKRLKILKEHGISLKKIQEIISEMELLPGAKEFLDWLRSKTQIIIVSDSFIEFAMPFMKKLGYPTLFCHDLETDGNGMISNYRLRLDDMKRKTVLALKKLNYEVIAIGDSYNDMGMIKEADHGILFKPPENVVKEFPQFPVTHEYSELIEILSNHLNLK